jgi:hypothetical protein
MPSPSPSRASLVKRPVAKASYNPSPVPDSAYFWQSAVVPLRNSSCELVNPVEPNEIQVLFELRLMEAIKAVRERAPTRPSADKVQLPAQTTSTGLAFWRTGPRDAFGRLQTY